MKIVIDRATGTATMIKPVTTADIERYNAALAAEVREKVFEKYREAQDAVSGKSNRSV